jgi:hypothetical protein
MNGGHLAPHAEGGGFNGVGNSHNSTHFFLRWVKKILRKKMDHLKRWSVDLCKVIQKSYPRGMGYIVKAL